ncbi:hypothetical protein ACOSOMT5_P0313 [Acidiphilium sp. MT5]
MAESNLDGVSLAAHHTMSHPATAITLPAVNPPSSPFSNPDLISLPDLNAASAMSVTSITPFMMSASLPFDAKTGPSVGVDLTAGTLHAASTNPGTYTTVTTSVAGNLTLVLDEASSVPTAMATALAYAATYLDKIITNPIAVTLQVNASSLGSGILGEGSDHSYYMALSKVEQYIAKADPSVANYLPSTLPAGVYGRIQVSKAEAQAWGVPASYFANQGRSYGVAGSVAFNNASPGSLYYGTGIDQGRAGTPGANQQDFFALALHEFTHALGRISANGGTQTGTGATAGYIFSPLNLFRFASPGTLQIDGVASKTNNTLPYFSVDGGKINLSYFATPSRTDWGQSPAAQNSHGNNKYTYVGHGPSPVPNYVIQDSFNGTSYPATPGYLTKLDLTELNALGFNVNYEGLNCFAAGTRILLRRGEVAVENLTIGDEVVLATGGTAPIRWIGQRSITLANQPNQSNLRPVLIKAGAILDGVPARDLLVSPDHAFFLDGHLIQAKTLLNGSTIRQVPRKRITYYHIELPTHAVLFAEGAPAESYLDTGNRTAFENAGIAVSLHPDFAPADAQALRIQQSCAPLIESGPVVEQIRARILARAAITTTNDPALTIETTPTGDSLIRSRHAIPGLLAPDPRDRRTLGVKILSLHAGPHKIPLDHPLLTEGWHNPEPDGRWTNGHAIIPAALHRGNPITLTLAATLNYPTAPAKRSAPEQKSG